MSFLSRVTGSPRLLLVGVAVACVAAVGGALVGQYRFDMLPCPWCTLQRLIFLVLAAVVLLAALVSPLRRPLAGLGVLLAACGIGTSLWLHFVASSSASCALTMADRIMQALGLYDAAPDVFAPMASIILADRVGQTHAEELCLTGRTVDAGVAHGMGIVNVIDEHPVDAAIGWAREQLGPKSASSLRFAVRAVRMAMTDRVRALLPAMERLYLEDLMRTPDAVEGLRAFLDKRPPSWRQQ